MHKYFINGKQVSKGEWSNAFMRKADAEVHLRYFKMPANYQPPVCENPITPEKLEKYKRKI